MKKAILSTERFSTLYDLKIFQLKNEIISGASGIAHHVDVDEIVGGGWCASVWVNDSIVQSGEYMIRMMSSIDQIEKAIQEVFVMRQKEILLDSAEDQLQTSEGQAAEQQVKKFFNLD